MENRITYKDFREDLRKWFSKDDPKGGWKRIGTDGSVQGPCARPDKDGDGDGDGPKPMSQKPILNLLHLKYLILLVMQKPQLLHKRQNPFCS